MVDSKEEPLTPQDMRLWLKQETLQVMRAAELRLLDATDFVTKYVAGEITREEANKRFSQYHGRWDDALNASVDESMTNAEILRAHDAPDTNWRELAGKETTPEKGRS